MLVTRPRHQAQGLVDALQALGARALIFPTLEIVPAPATDPLQARLRQVLGADWLIFVSPNAVAHGLTLIESVGGLPIGAGVAAVGRTTARCLHERGVSDVLAPDQGADSEALLALPAFRQVAGQRILIVRGVGGRELLGQTLRDRGARVEYAEVYRRAQPAVADRRLRDWLARDAIAMVTATSPAGLENLLAMAGPEGCARLLGLPLVVVSERMLQLAENLGFKGPIRVAAGAGDEAVSQAVVELRRQCTAS